MNANLVHFVCTEMYDSRFFLGSRVRGQRVDFEASRRHPLTVSYIETQRTLLNQSEEATRKFLRSYIDQAKTYQTSCVHIF